MNSFETNLYKAMSLCEGNFKYIDDFYKIYTFTTENISGYVKYFDLENKSLLTVGSSGDQILNAYFKGARDITLYDINAYAKYYVYLKIAAILCLDYNEFLEFFFKHGVKGYYNSKMFLKETFNKIKSTLRLLDYESYLFFDELFSLYSPEKIRDYIFDDDESRNEVIKSFNIYLRNETTYNKLKSSLKNINFKYINGDILKNDINGKFNNIFLSNICTLTNVDELKKLIEKLINNNLKEDGKILFAYLWAIDFHSNEYSDDWSEIYKMPITRNKLREFITEHHSIKGARDFLWDRKSKEDLVLIYKNKNN